MLNCYIFVAVQLSFFYVKGVYGDARVFVSVLAGLVESDEWYICTHALSTKLYLYKQCLQCKHSTHAKTYSDRYCKNPQCHGTHFASVCSLHYSPTKITCSHPTNLLLIFTIKLELT